MDVHVSGRLMFPKLVEPVRYQDKPDSKPRFGAQIAIEKGSLIDIVIKKAIESVAQEVFREKAPKLLKEWEFNTQKMCYMESKREEAPDMMILSAYASESSQPTTVGPKRQPLSPERFYGGCYVNAIVSIYAQKTLGQQGVRATLTGVQFVKDGPAFAGPPPARPEQFPDLGGDDDFDEIVAEEDLV